MKKRNKLLLVGLVVLALLAVLGAKQYSIITMGDDEWIGLGANAGRIVFDDQGVDEVLVMDADFGVGTDNPEGRFNAHVASGSIYETISTAGTGYARTYYKRDGIWEGSIGVGSNGNFSLGAGGAAAPTQLVLASNGKVGVNNSTPSYDLDILNASAMAALRVRSTAADARLIVDAAADTGDARLYWNEGGSSRWGLHYYAPQDYLRLYNYNTGHAIADFQDNDNINLVPDGGYVGIKDSTPSYELDVNGDIRATEDVIANSTIFIGEPKDATEDAARMTTRASTDDGGYVHWAMRNLTAGQLIFQSDVPGGGVAGPESLLWVQWLVNDNSGGPTITVGNASIDCLSGGGSNEVLIAGSGDNTLTLCMGRPYVEGDKCSVELLEEGSHNYDVSLLMMWVND